MTKLLPCYRLAICVVLLGLSQYAPAQDVDARIAKVIEDWSKRQKATNRVRYEVSGEETIPKGGNQPPAWLDKEASSKINPPRDITSPIKEVVLIDFGNGRFRVEAEKKQYDFDSDKFYASFRIRVFDGTQLKGWRPRAMNTHPSRGVKPNGPEIGVATGDLAGAGFSWGDAPYFAGHGSIMWDEKSIGPGSLRVFPPATKLVVHGQAAFGDRPCLVLRTQTRKTGVLSFNEFWIDSERDSALVKQLFHAGKTTTEEINIEYQHTEHGWFPKSWTVTERAMGTGHIRYHCKMTVDRLTLEPKPETSDFVIEERPGMILEASNYLPWSPEELLKGKEQGVEQKLYEIGEDGKRHLVTSVNKKAGWPYKRTVAVALGVLLLAVLAWLRHRKMKAISTKSGS